MKHSTLLHETFLLNFSFLDAEFEADVDVYYYTSTEDESNYSEAHIEDLVINDWYCIEPNITNEEAEQKEDLAKMKQKGMEEAIEQELYDKYL